MRNNRQATPRPLTRILLAAAIAAGGCSKGASSQDQTPPGAGGAPGTMPAAPFEPVGTRVYVNKVKSLLVGLPATDEDVAAVEKDPAALQKLVDAWFVTPEAQAKLMGFFKNAFQQTQITEADLSDQGLTRGVSSPVLLASVQEMFARTVLKLIADHRPFTDVLTTRTYMMNPALMSLYLYIDQTLRSDDEKKGMSVPTPDGSLTTALKTYATFVPPATGATMATAPTIPLTDTLNPKSPNYLHFGIDRAFSCPMPLLDATGHVMLDAMNKGRTMNVPYNERVFDSTEGVFSLLFGVAIGGAAGTVLPPLPPMPADAPPEQKQFYQRGPGCTLNQNVKALVTDEDFIWRPVKVRAPANGEKMVPFYDLITLRQSDELVVRAPRLGFFTTPAFFANWQTNKSNQSRDVLNQALIVALGKSINPVDSGPNTVLDVGKDGEHSDPTGPCYGCHQILDPTRQAFAKFYTYSYHRQENPAQRFSSAYFKAGDGRGLDSMDDFATALASDDRFAPAWVQKLCYYANSAPCVENDPEFRRVAAAFKASNYDFHALMRELLSSPLVTGTKATASWQNSGETISIARQNHLCAALTNRLHLTSDVCGSITNRNQAQIVSNNIPADGYLRGAEGPVLSTDPTMFFRGAVETICQIAADQVIDLAKGKSPYSSAQKDQAITDFVASIMGLGAADPIHDDATKILQDHYAQAVAKGATPTVALKSTFVVACTSPSSVAIGL